MKVVVAEALRPITRKGIADADAAGRIAVRAEPHDFGEIICGAGGSEFLEDRKIEFRFGTGETAAQIPPRAGFFGEGVQFAQQMGKGAVEPAPSTIYRSVEVLWLNGVEIAPPSIAVAAPLWVQCVHRCVAAPQRNAGNN